jgi:PAS domain S-box-containing protein
VNEKRSFDWAPLGLLLAGLAAVGLGGFFYIQKLDGVARAEAEENLTTVANSKVQEISEWRRERLQDAAYIRRTPYAARRALTVLGAPKVEANRTIFISWLQVLLLDHNYKRILLLDTNLNLCLAYPEGATPPLSRAVREGAAAALSARKVVAVDLEPGTQDDEVSLSFIVPLMVRPEGAANRVPATIKSEDPLYQSAALMVLQVDPQEFLYPLLRAWPTPSQTAETLLVRREGDEVVFLNELRHRKGSALKLRQPVSTKDLVVGMAARGQTGTVEGVDYRGMRVFAAIRAVPGTPWLLVAKEDEHEVFMALRQQARMIWAGMGVIVLALFLGVRLLGRRRDVDLLRRQLASEKQSREMAERVELLMHNANDIILFTDSKWQILEANARAVESYGYSREELLRFTLRDLCPPDTRGDFDRVTVQLAGGGSARFETVHQRKDGTTFPVESSDKVVDIGGVRYGVAFIRDITERAMREVEIRRLNRLYLIRSQLNQAMVRLHSREEFLREVCGVAVHSGEFKLAWVARHDALTGAITPLVCESEHRELVQQVRHTWKWDQECLCGWAVRDDRPAVVNDLRVASGFQQWQTEVAEAGVRSAAVFPLRLNGEVWGAFGVYAAETDVFQDREVAMLTEVASEISFGLEVLQGEQNRKLAEARLDALSDPGAD